MESPNKMEGPFISFQLLEMAHCRQWKKDTILIIVPQKSEPLGELSSQLSSSPQPELVVNNDKLSVYRALWVKKNNNDIVVGQHNK